jgi:hypothetical protein
MKYNYSKHDHKQLTIMSLRITCHGVFRLAKCCKECIFLIHKTVHKGWGVRNVVWSLDNQIKLESVLYKNLGTHKYGLSTGRINYECT